MTSSSGSSRHWSLATPSRGSGESARLAAILAHCPLLFDIPAEQLDDIAAVCGTATIAAEYPAGSVGKTAENLLAAADGELLEWGTLYPDFAQTADEEGFPDVAKAFREIANVESYHERRYRKLLENVNGYKVFKKDGAVYWKCRNCGYVYEGAEAPVVCPACSHPQSFYELWVENY